MEFVFKIFLLYLPMLFSLCFHEFAHGFVAKKFGDLTAFQMGRLSLNPIVHMDFIGTLFLPLTALYMGFPVFGWAKPVPVNTYNLQNPKSDLFWIAFAGPLSNFLLAILGTLILSALYILKISTHIAFLNNSNLYLMMEMFIYINLLLGFFNLIPLHPLDGGKVLARFLPTRVNIFLENNQHYSSLILIVLFIGGGFYYLAKPIISITTFLIQCSQFISSSILLLV